MTPSFRLINSPSAGQSEVLETLHFQGAVRSGVPITRLGVMVSERYHGDENRTGSDTQYEADVLAILVTLQGLGYVSAHDVNGAAVTLSGSTPTTVFVALTGTGRVQARAPRPRPRSMPY